MRPLESKWKTVSLVMLLICGNQLNFCLHPFLLRSAVDPVINEDIYIELLELLELYCELLIARFGVLDQK